MSPEAHVVELDPDTKTRLKMYLLKNVKNVETIRNKIITGVWNCAVIKPSLILDPFQVAVAANRAVVADKLNCMVTRTVYAEILYNLSLTKNITQSLSKFGIEKDKNLLVCFLVTEKNDNSCEVLSHIEGDPSPMSELSNLTCVKDVKSAYKLNNIKTDNGLLDVIVTRMVTKNIVSY